MREGELERLGLLPHLEPVDELAYRRGQREERPGDSAYRGPVVAGAIGAHARGLMAEGTLVQT